MSEHDERQSSTSSVPKIRKRLGSESPEPQHLPTFETECSAMGELKIRSNLLERYDMPTIARPTASQVSNRKESDTITKPTLPSRFGLTIKGCLLGPSAFENRTELLRQYELALDQIESALAEKNFQITKTIRQLEISLEEKQSYIEELTDSYEYQIETIEASYYKAIEKLMEAQNRNKEQQIRLKDLEVRLHTETNRTAKLTEELQEFHKDTRSREQKIGDSAKELCGLLEAQKHRTLLLVQSNSQLTKQCGQTPGLKAELGRVTAALLKLQSDHQIVQQSLSEKDNLCCRLQKQLGQIIDSRAPLKQTERMLSETHLIESLMMNDLNDAKEKLNKLTTEQTSNHKAMTTLKNELAQVKFENETLRSYNQSLLKKIGQQPKTMQLARGLAYRQPVPS